ncbi:MAG: GNAT family N-acetyltransferase [Turneriella sp.]
MMQNGGDISAYTIRRLVSGEAHRFAALTQLFAEVFGDDSYSVAKPGADYLEDLLQKQHVIPLIAEVNGNVVGGLVAYVLDKFEQARSEVYIYDLAVREEYRRRGIARNLILELKKHAQKAGAWVIYVQADKDEADLPARQLYAALGEREDVFHYDIAVN